MGVASSVRIGSSTNCSKWPPKGSGDNAFSANSENLQDIQRDTLSASLDDIGGEALAGSGFETEEPESGFSNTDEVGE